MFDIAKKASISILDKSVFRKRYNLNLDPDYKVIIISGSPRSGTTFLAETIADALDAAIIWEPLQDKVLDKYKLNCPKRPVLKDIQANKALQHYMTEIAGAGMLNYYNTWISNPKYRRRLGKERHTHLIIKFTRGNGIVDFYHGKDHVVSEMVILRNPYSVIASQIEHHEFREHPLYSPYSSSLSSIQKALESIESSLVRDLAITWASDYVNAKNSHADKIIYENISQNLNPLQEYLKGLIPDIKMLKSRKSSTYNPETADMGGYHNKWRKTLSESDIKTIQNVIRIFSLKREVYEDFALTI